MAPSALLVNFKDWDDSLSSTNPDYTNLHQEMLKAYKESMENVEILWRLANVTYMLSQDLDDDKSIIEMIKQVIGYGQKGFVLDQNNFQVNLWLSLGAGKLCQLESVLNAKLYSFSTFLKHLGICVKLNPSHHLVLYMEGRLHLSLRLLKGEEKEAVKLGSFIIPRCNDTEAEEKLRKSLDKESKLDTLVTLAKLLIIMKRSSEAKIVLEKALKLPYKSKWDQVIRSCMERQLEFIKSDSIATAYKNAVENRPMAKRVLSDRVRQLSPVEVAAAISQAQAKQKEAKEGSDKTKSK